MHTYRGVKLKFDAETARENDVLSLKKQHARYCIATVQASLAEKEISKAPTSRTILSYTEVRVKYDSP